MRDVTTVKIGLHKFVPYRTSMHATNSEDLRSSVVMRFVIFS